MPKIGNHVYIAPNTSIIGAITIGDNAVIGAGSVVLEDVPPNCTYAGVPAKLISERGSERFVNYVKE